MLTSLLCPELCCYYSFVMLRRRDKWPVNETICLVTYMWSAGLCAVHTLYCLTSYSLPSTCKYLKGEITWMYHRRSHFQNHHLLGKASSRKENVGLELFHLDLLIPALAIIWVSVSDEKPSGYPPLREDIYAWLQISISYTQEYRLSPPFPSKGDT